MTDIPEAAEQELIPAHFSPFPDNVQARWIDWTLLLSYFRLSENLGNIERLHPN